MSVIWVEITGTRGSTPRDAGTVMKISLTETEGTIGGGALEFAAIRRARALLAAGESDFVETIPLGANLGQCCGGAVTLRYTDQPQPLPIEGMPVHHILRNAPHPKHLWLWGAGHVGRAVVQAAHPQAFSITWIDSAIERFPPRVAQHVNRVPAADMPLLAARAPHYAHHLIFTYSHDIDLALCAALLRRGTASIGLIGSDTKWARFSRRLHGMGLDPSSITCPIGDKRLGKAPQDIARGTLTSLCALTQEKATA